MTGELLDLVGVAIFTLAVTPDCPLLAREPVAGLVPAQLIVDLTLDVPVQPLAVLVSPEQLAVTLLSSHWSSSYITVLSLVGSYTRLLMS